MVILFSFFSHTMVLTLKYTIYFYILIFFRTDIRDEYEDGPLGKHTQCKLKIEKVRTFKIYFYNPLKACIFE